MEGRIFAVDDDDINLRLVATTLERAGYEVVTASDGIKALEQIDFVRPDLVLLDVMMPGMDGYELCKRLRLKSNTANLPVMMLTALDTVEEKIKGFEAGADDFLPKPFSPDELQMRVKVLLRRSKPQKVEKPKLAGKVIAVYSLKGGVGVSTIAVNLAAGLNQLWGQPAVLVDLSLTAGQSALMLNLPFRHTWADLATKPTEEVDLDLVNSILLAHEKGIFVLAASPRPEQNEYLTAEKVTHTLNLLREQYQYLVLDMPHDFHSITLAGLDEADEILLVLAPELASVRATVSALDAFSTLKYRREQVHIVLNWIFQRHGLARKDIEAVLHKPVELVIPFAPETMVKAINLGNPIVIEEPESRLGSLFEDISYLLSLDKQKKERPSEPSAAWQRVYSRMQQRQQKR